MADREVLGRRVREIWVAFASENPSQTCPGCDGGGTVVTGYPSHPDDPCVGTEREVQCQRCGGSGLVPKESHVAPWEELSENDREVDRQIGEELFAMGAASEREACVSLIEERREQAKASWRQHTAAGDDGAARLAAARCRELRECADAVHALREGPSNG
jgi:hypothetical protein